MPNLRQGQVVFEASDPSYPESPNICLGNPSSRVVDFMLVASVYSSSLQSRNLQRVRVVGKNRGSPANSLKDTLSPQNIASSPSVLL